MKNTNIGIWNEIATDFEDDGLIFVDAYTTLDPNEGGCSIATINIETKEVVYFDKRARNNKFAQEVINEKLASL